MSPCDPCPGEPRCPHPGTMHDIEDYDDLRPMCCAEGCMCGKPEDAFMAALAPIADLMAGLQQAMKALGVELHDAMEATQEDFVLAPPQPACPPASEGDFPQVNGT